MKVGILTYHYAGNDGAIWQAYTLCTRLRKILSGHEVEIIDYRYGPKYEALVARCDRARWAEGNRLLDGLLGQTSIVSEATGELFAALNSEYDACVVGSDIIWQFDFRGSPARRFRSALETTPARPGEFRNRASVVARKTLLPDPLRIPFPNAYWLDPGLSCRKIAYSASVGYSDIARVPSSCRRFMRAALEAFDLVSVRDNPTLELVASLDPVLGKRVSLVPDPAWMFDGPLPDVARKLSEQGVHPDRKKAGILYSLNNVYGRRLNAFLPDMLRAKGFQVVSVIGSNGRADIDLGKEALGPLEWWSVIREMDLLVTERTHPNIAAIKYRTPFVNLDITCMLKRAGRSKSADMLRPFGLDRLCVSSRGALNEEDFGRKLDEALEMNWDWPGIDARTDENRRICEEYAGSIGELLDAG